MLLLNGILVVPIFKKKSENLCFFCRCLTGNIAEFVLSPIFSHRSSIFACHIEPVPGYRIYDIEYYVKYKGKIVNDRTLKAQRIFDRSGHPKRAVDVLVQFYFNCCK